MDKSFLNMDERFKGIESELKYDFNSSFWTDAEKVLNDTALDQAFVEAASVSAFSGTANFENVQDAFLDSAFADASAMSSSTYDSEYFKDFKNLEPELHQSDSFVEAAAMSSVEYQQQYWSAADTALKNEGLHYEYKPQYWKEAEMLLLKKERKFFFYKWGAVVIGLLLISFLGININKRSLEEGSVALNDDVNLSKENKLGENQANFDKVVVQSNVGGAGADLVDDKLGSELYDVENENGVKTISSNDFITKSYEGNTVETNTLPGFNELSTEIPMPKTTDLSHEKVLKVVNSELEGLEKVIKLKRGGTFYLTETQKSANLIDKRIEIKPIVIEPKNELSLKIGKGIGNSFGNSLGKISPRSSIAFSYVFTPVKKIKRFGFGLDLGVYHMNLANFEYERSYSVHHDYGSVDHYWYKMVYKDLVFLSTNFSAYLNVGKGSKIKLGVGVDYLMTSRVGSEFRNSINEGTTIVEDSWGLSKAMNMSDITIGLGYEYQLNPKFSFLVDSKVGFKDKVNTNYMKGNLINRDLSIQLGIKYNIFTK